MIAEERIEEYEKECFEQHCIHGAAIEAVMQETPGEEELAEMAELFKVFGDSTRIRILFALSKKELCVCDLAEMLGMTQPAMSYQLKIIRQARLIKNRREGKTVYYTLADDHVRTIIGMAREHLEE